MIVATLLAWKGDRASVGEVALVEVYEYYS
jgi:hypothetical protein